jgi:hypothetical protein
MSDTGMTRREANRWLAAAAAGAWGGALAGPYALAARAGAGQPKGTSGRQPGQGSEPKSILDEVITHGREHDWTFRSTVNINMLDKRDENGMPVEEFLKFDQAVVIFPVLYGSGSHEVNTDAVKGEFRLNDKPQDSTVEFSDSYQSGARYGRWAMTNKVGREVELQVEIPMMTWETKFDERLAAKLDWPSAWPVAAQTALTAQAFINPADAAITQLVAEWTNGKDPKSIKPVQLAKWLAGNVQQLMQINGTGTTTADNGLIEGIEVRDAGLSAREGEGTVHDLACVLCAVYRAAGLPARPVIGWDVSEAKGDDNFLSRKGGDSALRSWVEFCLYDEETKKEAWIPVDITRIRNRSSRMRDLDRPWKYFGEHDELDDVMPIAFHYHPPVAGVVAHGSPALYGWFTTPTYQQAEQFVRFTSITTPKRSNDRRRPQGR